MAEIREVLKSRLGTEQGPFRVVGLMRTFYVTIDSIGDNPIMLIQGFNNDGGHLADSVLTEDSEPFVRRGSSHPWDRTALAFTFRLNDQINRFKWVVDVGYLTNEQFRTFGSWRLRDYQLGTEQENIRETIPSADASTSPPTPIEPKLIGPNIFTDEGVDQSDASQQMFSAQVKGQTLYLRNTGQRVLVGATRPRAASSITIERIQPSISPTMMKDLRQFSHTCNHAPFRINSFAGRELSGLEFGPARHIRLTACSITSEPGDWPVLFRQSEPGVVYRVSLTFNWSSVPYTPISFVAEFRNKDGSAPVIDVSTNEKVVEDFPIIETRDFGAIFSILGSGL